MNYFLFYSPSSSRPPTPIKSDTEYEVERQRSDFVDGSNQTDDKWSWQWGQLPTPPPTKTPLTRKNSSKCHNKNEENVTNIDPNIQAISKTDSSEGTN